MAARKPPVTDDDQPGTEENDQIDSIMAELGGDNIKLSLYRISPGTGSAGAWIDDISSDQVEDMKRYVRDEFGGGSYIVRILRNGKFYKQVRFAIEAARKIPGAAAAAPAPASDGLTQILLRQEENQRRILEMLSARNDRPQFDPFEMFTRVAELVKGMKADAPAVGAADLMTAWNKGLETAQKQLELARSIGAGGQGETGLMDLIRSGIESFGPALAPAIAEHLAQKGPAKPPAPNNAPLLPGRVDEPNGHAAQLDAHLKQLMQTLGAKAALNADVGLYAEWTFDNLDPQLVEMLLSTPGILDRLETPFPAVKQFRPWFDALLAQMIAMSAAGNEGQQVDQAGTD